MNTTEALVEALGKHTDYFTVNGTYGDDERPPKGWIYVTDKMCRNVRYILGQPGADNMLIIGINPNDGVPGKPERSVRGALKSFEAWKETQPDNHKNIGWLLVNIYPSRTRTPKYIIIRKRLIVRNLIAITVLKKVAKISHVWPVWGNSIELPKFRGILASFMLIIARKFMSSRWLRRQKLNGRDGDNVRHPRHMMFMKKSEIPVCFCERDSYLANMAAKYRVSRKN